jgi:hypothetical protein
MVLVHVHEISAERVLMPETTIVMPNERPHRLGFYSEELLGTDKC